LAVNPLGSIPAWRYPRMAVNPHGGQSPIKLLLVTAIERGGCITTAAESLCRCITNLRGQWSVDGGRRMVDGRW